MKVVILGPAIQKNKSGGVAVFDEGLYKGFQQNGDEVFLISVGKSADIENICLSKKRIRRTEKKLMQEIKNLKNKKIQLRCKIKIINTYSKKIFEEFDNFFLKKEFSR